MKLWQYPILSIFCVIQVQCHTYQWAVVGAGPAGIIAVSVLMEHGIQPEQIAWIDPAFNVGRLGKFYRNVPSNQMASRYTRFLKRSTVFSAVTSPTFDAVFNYQQNQEPSLNLIVDPLLAITQHLSSKVASKRATITELKKFHNNWMITMPNSFEIAHKVILATGSTPKTMKLDGFQEIPVDLALDESTLKTLVSKNDKVIVIGSAHSALLILKYLSELPVASAINFYTKTPTYGRYGGLEGITAHWTKNSLEQHKPNNVQRILFDQKLVESYKNKGYKIIYAYGFEPEQIKINNISSRNYDAKTGNIAHNLYGIGIAFPELYNNKGTIIPLIGVNSFIERAQKLIPTWIKA